ncbi:MAG: Gfo/Idh/MocA family oxidoreductase [Deltaproteobacteria bacterium]|nr:Gfo/Idh/MocA family oxidoreductase [Deltaproteobacteria bacterium]
MSEKTVRIGIIGGGLMGRELASAIGRWFVLEPLPDRPELVAVCDAVPGVLDWFRRVPTVTQFATDYRALLDNKNVDIVYIAVPHDLHERMYIDCVDAGKDLLAEKPFGIDRQAANNIALAVKKSKRFVRVSSEFPFLPAMYRTWQYAASGALGRLIEVRSAFNHSSDMDPSKPINWKRQAKRCGELGVLADLGLHPLHVPVKLGWRPVRVHAQLTKIYDQRPDGKGGMAACDTWDNALLNTDIRVSGHEVPMRIEMKRLSPGDTNNWLFEAYGTEGAVKFSSSDTKAFRTFERRGTDQSWSRIDMGFQTPFKVSTGGIFEAGFPDCYQQMWAAFLAERAGVLGDRLGCVTVEEALFSHDLFAAAMQSHREKSVVALETLAGVSA